MDPVAIQSLDLDPERICRLVAEAEEVAGAFRCWCERFLAEVRQQYGA